MDLNYNFVLPGARETVFAYIANPAHESRWRTACTESVVSEGPIGVGTTYENAFAFSGRALRFIGEITAYEPGQRYAFRSTGGSFPVEGEYSFHDHPEGTEVRMHLAAEPGRFFGIVPLMLLRKLMLAELQRDVAALARRVKGGWTREVLLY